MPMLSHLHHLFNAEQCQTYLGGVLKVEICCLRMSTSLCFQSSKTSGFYRHLHF